MEHKYRHSMLDVYDPLDVVHTAGIYLQSWDVAHTRCDFFTYYVFNIICELDYRFHF